MHRAETSTINYSKKDLFLHGTNMTAKVEYRKHRDEFEIDFPREVDWNGLVSLAIFIGKIMEDVKKTADKIK